MKDMNILRKANLSLKHMTCINMHLRYDLSLRELDPVSTVKKYLTVQAGKNRHVHRNISFYGLDMILAIGYRLRSERGTQFRIWTTQHVMTSGLPEYLYKFLRESDLPILESPAKVSHQETVYYAENQYLEYETMHREFAEKEAEKRFLEDLKSSVKLVAAKGKKK